MTLEEIIAAAHGHFVALQNINASAAILTKYALEQAAITGEDLPTFIKMMQRSIKEEKDSTVLNWFYAWYYVNYVIPVLYPKRYNTEIVVPEADDFVRTMIYPVREIIEDGEPEVIWCDPGDAEFWSVYLVAADGSSTVIADCVDQKSAQDLETLAYCIAANFKPEIWQKEK